MLLKKLEAGWALSELEKIVILSPNPPKEGARFCGWAAVQQAIYLRELRLNTPKKKPESLQ